MIKRFLHKIAWALMPPKPLTPYEKRRIQKKQPIFRAFSQAAL